MARRGQEHSSREGQHDQPCAEDKRVADRSGQSRIERIEQRIPHASAVGSDVLESGCQGVSRHRIHQCPRVVLDGVETVRGQPGLDAFRERLVQSRGEPSTTVAIPYYGCGAVDNDNAGRSIDGVAATGSIQTRARRRAIPVTSDAIASAVSHPHSKPPRRLTGR